MSEHENTPQAPADNTPTAEQPSTAAAHPVVDGATTGPTERPAMSAPTMTAAGAAGAAPLATPVGPPVGVSQGRRLLTAPMIGAFAAGAIIFGLLCGAAGGAVGVMFGSHHSADSGFDHQRRERHMRPGMDGQQGQFPGGAGMPMRGQNGNGMPGQNGYGMPGRNGAGPGAPGQSGATPAPSASTK